LVGSAGLLTFWLVLRVSMTQRRRTSGLRSTEEYEEIEKLAALDERLKVRRKVPVQLPSSSRVLEADLIKFDRELHSGGSGNDAALTQRLFIFFPGNPGLVDFYFTMLRSIFDHAKGEAHVVAIGHAGHSVWAKGDEEPVSYTEQIQHKIAVLRQEYPWFESEHAEVYISGHSVGARIAMELMHQLPHVNWQHYFGLCPTVMNIADSPNGRKVTPLLKLDFLRRLVFYLGHPLALLVRMLPEWMAHHLTKMVMKNDCPDVHDHFVASGMKLMDPHILHNVVTMGNEEMQTIKDVDHFENLLCMQDKMSFVFSVQDKWCPPEIVDQMRQRFPKAHFHELHADVRHAFCLNHDHVEHVVEGIRSKFV